MEAKKQVAVLIIDDDDVVLDTLGRMIEKAGWKCLKAPSGEIGMDALKASSVDAVVLDINLPRMGGFEVLRKLKEQKPGIPVIMLTALGYEKDQVDKAVELGAAGYISKGMPVKSVISKIKTVLGK